jgi:hypothetical protein
MNEKLAHIFLLIEQYYSGIVDIAGLEQNISLHFSDFDSVDERKIYYPLKYLVAGIELIRFTVNDDKQMEAVKSSVEDFKSNISLE